MNILIMIAAAYNQHSYYLQTLSYLSGKLKNNELRASILAAKTEQDVYKLLVSE